MIYTAVLTSFLSVFMLIYGMLIKMNKDKIDIETRMKQVKDIYTENHDDVGNRPFSERMLRPFYQAVSKLLLKATPSHKLNMLSKRLERAGLLKNSTKERWLYIRSMVILMFSTLLALLSYLLDPNIFKALGFFLLIALIGNTFFNFYISKRIQARKKNILRDLPYTLDLITVSVEAGLSFDGAIARVVSNIGGELCDEFSKSLKEIRMGIQRKAALKSMGERCDVEELSMFITSVIQADELGVSLGRVLRLESANLREKRKQAAREKAMKAPVKMLFPLIFFIFPSIFIVILGPAVISIITTFTQGAM